jgi:hypothetical protein
MPSTVKLRSFPQTVAALISIVMEVLLQFNLTRYCLVNFGDAWRDGDSARSSTSSDFTSLNVDGSLSEGSSDHTYVPPLPPISHAVESIAEEGDAELADDAEMDVLESALKAQWKQHELHVETLPDQFWGAGMFVVGAVWASALWMSFVPYSYCQGS